jgi:hypothetical protein
VPELPIFALELPTLTTHFFILRWVVHILDGGVEDIGFGCEFRMKIIFRCCNASTLAEVREH